MTRGEGEVNKIVKKTLVAVTYLTLILLAGSIFSYERKLFTEQFNPVTQAVPALIQTLTSSDSASAQFGVVAQYYRSDEKAAYYPDLWTLVDYVGAKYVSGAVRRWAADEAAQHGVKLIMSYTAPQADPNNPKDFASKETVKAHFDLYNIAQYRDHPGVYGHVVHGEPCANYSFDPRYPDSRLLALIDNFKYACDYVRSLDPTHPVWISLDPAGAFWGDTGGLLPSDVIEKRKAWINLFMPFCDVLDYHYYAFGDAGREYWRNPDVMRSNLVTMLDQVLIPCANGKPIIIGEMGCPTEDFKDWKGQIATFTEEQQAEYFRIYGEETRKRNIPVFIFKLIDPPGETHRYGLFRASNDGTMNIPKVAAGLVEKYLSGFENRKDLNKDGRVDMLDIVMVASAFQAKYNETDGMYWHDPPCPRCPHVSDVDMDKNKVIDMIDLMIVASSFGSEND